jgi:hypothetical protein
MSDRRKVAINVDKLRVERHYPLPYFPMCVINVGGSGAIWNMGQNETSLYFCMKQVLKCARTMERFSVECKNDIIIII